MNEMIGDEENVNLGVTSDKLAEELAGENRIIEILDEKTDFKRVFHFIACDKILNAKSLFRAIRNGGYLISSVDFDEEELYDAGFSAINRLDGFLIAKKVHSWNDW
jgi:hypothetical protein